MRLYVVICQERGADCLHMVQLVPLPSSLASFKSRVVLPFWYRLTQRVLEKRPLNGCSSSSSCSMVNAVQRCCGVSASLASFFIPELSMGPFRVTQPNPTQPNTANNGAYSLVVTYFYTQNLSVSRTCQIGHKITFNCLAKPDLI